MPINLKDLLAPARDEIQSAIDLIQTIDCRAIVPGAQEEP